MSKKKPEKNNLQLAGLFIAVVVGLVVLSFVVKLIFVIQSSRFDGIHKFNVLFVGASYQEVVSFIPQSHSISILRLNNFSNNLSETLDVPIDGTIRVKGNLNDNNISTSLLKYELAFGQGVEKLTFLDLLRLGLFSRTVASNSIYKRELSSSLSNMQNNTLISLTFTDPTIYEENLSVEIVNATQVNGLGARLATFISNIGGNPVLVTSSDTKEIRSKLIYYGQNSYTVKKLSSYFNIQTVKTDSRGIADVIIIIGKDMQGKF